MSLPAYEDRSDIWAESRYTFTSWYWFSFCLTGEFCETAYEVVFPPVYLPDAGEAAQALDPVWIGVVSILAAFITTILMVAALRKLKVLCKRDDSRFGVIHHLSALLSECGILTIDRHTYFNMQCWNMLMIAFR